ncbi:MAG: LUD domain-containing protein [Proteobacteria bacterium]|nr:LUD domain-containing protein [Pseudomonadota bacterium]
MSARDEILSAIRTRRVKNAPRPARYAPPPPESDLVKQFADRARRTAAEVQILNDLSDVPAAVADILRGKNMEAAIHLPPHSPFAALDWKTAPGLSLESKSPGPDDAALALVPFGIAETGTLVNPARDSAPASWHFRPGLEIAVIHTRDILPHMENVFARIKQSGALPHTINFVSGPSRTGDIEQTLELGAHGPKALAILIVEEA